MPKLPGAVAVISPSGIMESAIVSSSMSKPNAQSNLALPPFIAMPQSSAKLTNRISNTGASLQDTDNEILHESYQVIALVHNAT